MTKEELEKEARFRTKGWKEQENCVQAYLAGAKPREKRIEELTEQNTSLLTSVENLNKSVQDLEDKLANADFQLEGRDSEIRELKAQIEKLKCCGNCNNTWNGYHLDICDDCKNHDKWEIKENAELKEYNKYLKRQRQGGIQKQYNKMAIIKQKDEQLTKAKELLKKYVIWCGTATPIKSPLQIEVEQFLKEVEK